MDFQCCPKCEAFNPPGAKVCEQCGAALPEVTESTSADTANAAVEPAPAEAAVPVPEEGIVPPPAPPEPPPFDGPPEILARIEGLEAEIAKKPQANALYLQLSQVYLDASRKDLAAKAIERRLEHDPTNAYLRHRLGQITGVHPPGAPAFRPQFTAAPGRTPMRPAYRPSPRRCRRAIPRWAIAAAVAGVLVVAIGVKLLFFPGPKVAVTGPFSAVNPTWSPTGRHFAFVMEEGERTRLGVYDVRQGTHRPLGELQGWGDGAFAWSPDGRRIAYVSPDEEGWGGVVSVVDVASGASQRVAEGRSPLWLPGGQTLLMWCTGSGALDLGVSEDEMTLDEVMWAASREMPGPCRVDVASGEVLQRTSDPEREWFGWGSSISPLLAKVAYERLGDSEAAPVDRGRSGDGEFVDMVDAVAARGATNIAQGSRDLSRELEARQYEEKRRGGQADSGFERDVWVVDYEGGTPRQLTHDGRSGSPSWTPDGQRILFVSQGQLWLMAPDGSDRRQAYSGPLKLAEPPAAQLTADGKYVVFVAQVAASEGVSKLMTGEDPADLFIASVGGSAAKRLSNRHPFKQRFALSPVDERIVYEFLVDPGTLTDRRTRSELWLMKH